ncbi:hypothetical protein DIQ79_21205 [Mycolicibacterium smegmatis]|uniref:Uncharacterized protein n=1 Tax=Mycolicibacterium smegmatis (strain ATCC 700084 / mc(2)155) TaxID=246196 RepID=A0QUL7_MYCS2|nr:hypothetical protein MSMEG_2253 [Mycolicibacterium smegmatis MC2 155]TBM47197.1 hypothetical protein DIQ86_12280 [Mycolicibacterium smegmatis]TBH33900.1 hypothetical protein EYS45_20190 [Mycolicibacterium smegmatis MC2 155]TBM49194.1 hypothetical protein DIQ85_20840 [Mycolicibacterium smegmatis]TBM59200.1 hypothetical protein DIQ83_20900 [Mycolicibacterium smegmatis]
MAQGRGHAGSPLREACCQEASPIGPLASSMLTAIHPSRWRDTSIPVSPHPRSTPPQHPAPPQHRERAGLPLDTPQILSTSRTLAPADCAHCAL